MYYVVFSKNGVVGYTSDFSKVETMLNYPWAFKMEYSYEVRPSEPEFLDRL